MSSSTLPIFCAIFAFLCGLLVSISAEKNSTAPIYVRYVRRRPPWFPGDLYVEEVVEEFRTKGRPPMFGSSEDDIQRFLERDQKLSEVKEKKPIPVKWDKRNNSALRKMIKPPIEELKPTITVTIYKPSSPFDMRVNDVNTPSEPWATTMKVPYTNVITKSAEIDYYDFDEGGSYVPSTPPRITTTTTTQRPIWKPFGQSKIVATLPTITTTTTTLSSLWVPFGAPTLSPTTVQTTTKAPSSFWMPFVQPKTTTTPPPATTATTEKPRALTTSTTTQRPYSVFNLFGKSTMPSSTTETPTITTSETESYEELTNTELSPMLESTKQYITNAGEVITDNILGESTEVTTSTPAETEGSNESITTGLGDDYVNGEVVDSIEEDHTAVPSLPTIPTSTEEPEEVATTTRKSGLFGWLG